MDNSLRSPITGLRARSNHGSSRRPCPRLRAGRAGARYATHGPTRRDPVFGTALGRRRDDMNVSLTGGLVRLPEDTPPDHELFELDQGDEIFCPACCDPAGRLGCRPGRNVLRLRFFPTPDAEVWLQDLIGRLAHPLPVQSPSSWQSLPLRRPPRQSSDPARQTGSGTG